MTAMVDRARGIVNFWLKLDIVVQHTHRANMAMMPMIGLYWPGNGLSHDRRSLLWNHFLIHRMIRLFVEN